MSALQPSPGGAVTALLADAMAHHRAGRLEPALALYGRVLALEPDNADALNLGGLARLALGDAQAAIEAIGRATRLQPRSPLFHHNLGTAQAAAGLPAKAIASFERALKLKPDMAEAWVALGLARSRRGEDRKAAHALRRAVAVQPECAEAWHNLGLVLAKLGEPDDAREALDHALALRPDVANAHNSAGVLAREAGDLERARAHLERAVALDPGSSDARANLAVALTDLRAFDAAVAAFESALAQQPNHAEAWRGFAKPLVALGELERARNACDQARKLAPEDPRNTWERALIELAAGNFAAGWDGYRARPTIDRARRPCPATPLPATLAGRAFILEGEQGLGEELFFLRFAANLKARGAHITARVDARLTGMVGRLAFIDAVEARDPESRGNPAAPALMLGDLPWLAGADDDTPAPGAIAPLAPVREALRARLAAVGPAPYLALTWRAGIKDRHMLYKEAPIDLIADSVKNTGATLIALQRNPAPGEIDALAQRLGRPVADFTDLNDDLESALAALHEIETYVCVSNTNVHLAAAARAAGAKVRAHVLVPCPAEFRWLARGEGSPWFPRFTVHRESARAGWRAARDGLIAALSGI